MSRATHRDIDESVFKALADPTRRGILDLLYVNERTTGDLVSAFPKLSRCTVMLHLGILEEAGLVIVRRDGRFRWNYLDVAPIQRIQERWIGKYAERAAAGLLALKRELEE